MRILILLGGFAYWSGRGNTRQRRKSARQRLNSPRSSQPDRRRGLGLIQVVADDHHRHDHPRHNHRGKCPEDHVTPLDPDPIPMFTVAATVNLGFQKIQDGAFPEFPAASFDVIRLTAWTLHGQGIFQSLPEPLRVTRKCAPKQLD
jgi:hypothetical protein